MSWYKNNGGEMSCYPVMQEQPELRWALTLKIYVIPSLQLLFAAAAGAALGANLHFLITTCARLGLYIFLIIPRFIVPVTMLLHLSALRETWKQLEVIWDRHFRWQYMKIGAVPKKLLLLLLIAPQIVLVSAQKIPGHPASAPQNAVLVVVACATILLALMRIIVLASTSAPRSRKIFGIPGTCSQILYSLVWLIFSVVVVKRDINKVAALSFLFHSIISCIYLLFIDNRRVMAIIMGILTVPCVGLYISFLQFGFSLPKEWEAPLGIIGLSVLAVVQAFQITELEREGFQNERVDKSLMVLDVVIDFVASAFVTFLTLKWDRDMVYIMVTSGVNSFSCIVKFLLFFIQATNGPANNGDGLANNVDGLQNQGDNAGA